MEKTPGVWMHEACRFAERDCRCMSSPGSCSEGTSVSLWCISAWQDSSRHRKPCTWWEVWIRSFLIAMTGGVRLAKRYHAGKCGECCEAGFNNEV